MKAVRIHEFGGPEVLKTEEVPEPTLGPGDVLIQMEASGVNHADVRRGGGGRAGKVRDAAAPLRYPLRDRLPPRALLPEAEPGGAPGNLAAGGCRQDPPAHQRDLPTPGSGQGPRPPQRTQDQGKGPAAALTPLTLPSPPRGED